MSEFDKLTIEDYNNEPVYYCPHCLSLRVKSLNSYIDYCDECGNTEIETTTIEEWQKMYKLRFNKYYSNYGREDNKKSREGIL